MYNNKITKNSYTSNSIFLVFFVSILALSLFMFYMPTSYSQTESDEIIGGGEQVCLEGEVLNTETQMCESTTPIETTTTPTEDISGDGVVDELDIATGLDAEKAKKAPPKKKISPAPKFLCNSNSPTLKFGSQGDTVVKLQKILKGAKHLTGSIDGIFGPATEAAVKSFQQPNLDADGIVGHQTWKKLCDLADYWNKNPQFAPKV
jgi:hypothetical protein